MCRYVPIHLSLFGGEWLADAAVFFSYNKSANSIFNYNSLAKQTGSTYWALVKPLVFSSCHSATMDH
jgi:hypothetical protein